MDWRDPGPDQVCFSSMIRHHDHLVAAVARRPGQSAIWLRASCGLEHSEGPKGWVESVSTRPDGRWPVCPSCRHDALASRILGRRMTGPPGPRAPEGCPRGRVAVGERLPAGGDGHRPVLIHTDRSRHSNVGSGGIGGTVKLGIEASIAQRYLTTDQSTITVTRGLTVNVPADRAGWIMVRWYEHRTLGVARPERFPTLAAAPFSVVVGLTHDVETVAD
jgi:hypothetical protein